MKLRIFTMSLVAVCCSALVTSCGGSAGGAIDLTDKDALQNKLKPMLEEKIDPESKIISVSFVAAARETKEMDVVVVQLYEPGNTEKTMNYTFYPGGMGPFMKDESPGSMTFTASADQGARLAELDLAQIADYVAKGASIIENDRNCIFTGISSYRMSVDKDSGQWEHDFKLSNKIDQAKKDAGENVIYSYPELDFTADATGNVERKRS